MKLTPREPTPSMVDAGQKAAHWTTDYVTRVIWRAMHDAAPSGWQPIETAPKDGRTVIVGRDMGDFGFVRGTGRFHGKPGSFGSGWVCRGFDDPPGELGLAHPTLWMPLPAPPTEKGE